MRATALFLALSLAGGCLAFGISGCGGGSGAAPPMASKNLFSGSYDVAAVWGMQIPVPSRVAGMWGTAVADGAQSVSLAAASNELGVIDPAYLVGTLDYSIGLDRTLGWRSTGGPFLDVWSGGISADGHVAALAGVQPSQPGVFLLTRRVGSWSDASLTGDYHLCGFTFNHVLALHTGWMGTITFDGTGGASVSVGANYNGTIAPFGPSPVLYAVAPDGAVTMDFGGSITVQGSLTGGGDVVIASGSTTSGGPAAIYALVRASAATSAATFSGEYHVAGFAKDTVTNEHRCMTGWMRPDGATNVSWITRNVVEQDAGVRGGGIGTFTVVGNGSLLISTQLNDNLRGAVSPTGDFAVLGRISDPGSDPTFLFLFR